MKNEINIRERKNKMYFFRCFLLYFLFLFCFFIFKRNIKFRKSEKIWKRKKERKKDGKEWKKSLKERTKERKKERKMEKSEKNL